MKSKKQLVIDVMELARGIVPMPDILDFSLDKGKELADTYGGDKEIIVIAMSLMDLKIPEAREKGDITLHTQLASFFAKDFLKDYDISLTDLDKIINCIEAHHGRVPFCFIEAEICANADCFVFVHPKGVFAYTGLLSKRGLSFEEQIKQLDFKLNEKYKLLSLDKAKDELEVYYKILSSLYKTILSEK